MYSLFAMWLRLRTWHKGQMRVRIILLDWNALGAVKAGQHFSDRFLIL